MIDDDEIGEVGDDETESPPTQRTSRRVLRRTRDRERPSRSRSVTRQLLQAVNPQQAFSQETARSRSPQSPADPDGALGAVGGYESPPSHPQSSRKYQALPTEQGLTSESEGSSPGNRHLFWGIDEDEGSDLDPYRTNEQLQRQKRRRTRRVATYPRRFYALEEQRRYVDTSDSELERFEDEDDEDYNERKSTRKMFLTKLKYFTEEEKKALMRFKVCIKKLYGATKKVIHALTDEEELTTNVTNILHRIDFLIDVVYDETLCRCLLNNPNNLELGAVIAHLKPYIFSAFGKLQSIYLGDDLMEYSFHDEDGKDSTSMFTVLLDPDSPVLFIYFFFVDWLVLWMNALCKDEPERVMEERDNLRSDRDLIVKALKKMSVLPEEPVLQIPSPNRSPGDHPRPRSILKRREEGAVAARGAAAPERRVTMNRYSQRQLIKLYHNPRTNVQSQPRRY